MAKLDFAEQHQGHLSLKGSAVVRRLARHVGKKDTAVDAREEPPAQDPDEVLHLRAVPQQSPLTGFLVVVFGPLRESVRFASSLDAKDVENLLTVSNRYRLQV